MSCVKCHVDIFCDILLELDVGGSVINEAYLFFYLLFFFYLCIKPFWDKLAELVSEVSVIRGAAAGIDFFLSTHSSPIEDNIFLKKKYFPFS